MTTEVAGKLRLGVDIGGTKVAFALGDHEGQLLAHSQRPTDPSGNGTKDVRRMAAELRELVAGQDAEWQAISALGVSVPGPLDRDRGVVLHPPNLQGWEEVPVREIFARELGLPVVVENDANAAALAEARHGAGRGRRHLVYLTMSTGVGAGLVLDEGIYRGQGTLAGEIGHSPVEWPGEPCACGLTGCLEAYVGGAAWSRRLQELTPESSRVAALAADSGEMGPRAVVEAARAGDTFALAEMDRFNTYLARAIVQLQFTLAPDAVVLGTIAVAAGDDLCFGPLRDKVRAALWPGVAERLAIVPAQLGSDLPYHAALCAAG